MRVIVLALFLCGCAKPIFDPSTGLDTTGTLQCDLVIDGSCEFYSRATSLIPLYNELKP